MSSLMLSPHQVPSQQMAAAAVTPRATSPHRPQSDSIVPSGAPTPGNTSPVPSAAPRSPVMDMDMDVVASRTVAAQPTPTVPPTVNTHRVYESNRRRLVLLRDAYMRTPEGHFEACSELKDWCDDRRAYAPEIAPDLDLTLRAAAERGLMPGFNPDVALAIFEVVTRHRAMTELAAENCRMYADSLLSFIKARDSARARFATPSMSSGLAGPVAVPSGSSSGSNVGGGYSSPVPPSPYQPFFTAPPPSTLRRHHSVVKKEQSLSLSLPHSSSMSTANLTDWTTGTPFSTGSHHSFQDHAAAAAAAEGFSTAGWEDSFNVGANGGMDAGGGGGGGNGAAMSYGRMGEGFLDASSMDFTAFADFSSQSSSTSSGLQQKRSGGGNTGGGGGEQETSTSVTGGGDGGGGEREDKEGGDKDPMTAFLNGMAADWPSS
ncbi:hypothetical protein HKX48_002936 [Thoreauomyces humboldtii]|nr:hypothetical protein HKX48_002936 [Thoreauomyces humboldtii]